MLDATNQWCEAEIVKINQQNQEMYVSYLYWDNTYDEWISNIEDRTAPLHTHTYCEGNVA